MTQPTPDARPVVLVVDDEPDILNLVALLLRREHTVLTAVDGEDALRVLAANPPVAAVVSDMRMPKMDGVELLRRVQLEYPDATRILHTAHTDVTAAIAAINSGGVFRYVTKASGTDELRAVVRDAVALNARTTGERQMLDQTLKASVQALFSVLEMSSPVSFARAGRIRTVVEDISRQMQLSALWEIEVAAMASQLGAVTVPPTVLQKLDKGQPCSPEEQAMIDAMPGVAAQLLSTIPMLEDVVEIVRGLSGPRPTASNSPIIDAAIDIVRVAMEFETLTSRGVEADSAITVLECRENAPMVTLAALRAVKGFESTAVQQQVRGLRVIDLESGMRVAQDIVTTTGLVLIGRGMVVTDILLDRLANFARTVDIVEPVLAIPGARLR